MVRSVDFSVTGTLNSEKSSCADFSNDSVVERKSPHHQWKEKFYPDHDPAVTSVGCGIMFEM